MVENINKTMGPRGPLPRAGRPARIVRRSGGFTGSTFFLAPLLAVFCLLVGVALNEGRLAVTCSGFAALLCIGFLIVIAKNVLRAGVVLLTALLFQGVIALFFLLTMFSLPEEMMMMHPFLIIAEAPVGVFVSLTVVSFGLVIAMLLLSSAGLSGFSTEQLLKLTKNPPAKLEMLLVLFAGFNAVHWMAIDPQFVDSLPAYIVRIVVGSVGWAPLLAGYYIFRLRYSTIAWCITFGISLLLAFFTGSRGYFFLALLPFVIGIFVALDTWHRRLKWAVRLFPAGVAIFLLAAVIGQTRSQVGRMSVIAALEVGPTVVLQEAKRVIGGQGEAGTMGSVAAVDGVARMVPWCNLSVPLMTPLTVPYRGVTGLWEEATVMFAISRFGGRNIAANENANNYGFLVNEATSVEFGVVADGWSRFGLLGAVVFTILGAIGLTLIERFLFRLCREHFAIFLLCFCVLIDCAVYGFSRTGLFAALRSAGYSILVVGLIARALELFIPVGNRPWETAVRRRT